MEYKSSSSIFKKIGDQERKHRVDKLIDDIHDKRSKTKTTRNEKIIAVLYLLSLDNCRGMCYLCQQGSWSWN